jgi:hypothetical protein
VEHPRRADLRDLLAFRHLVSDAPVELLLRVALHLAIIDHEIFVLDDQRIGLLPGGSQ